MQDLLRVAIKKDSENTFMQKLDKYMMDNGTMMRGTARESTHWFLDKLLLKAHGKMVYFTATFKLRIKMDKSSRVSMLTIRKMVQAKFNIKMGPFLMVILRTILLMDSEKSLTKLSYTKETFSMEWKVEMVLLNLSKALYEAIKESTKANGCRTKRMDGAKWFTITTKIPIAMKVIG